MTKRKLFWASSFFRHSSFEPRHSTNAHSETGDELLGEIINSQRNREKHQSDHEKSPVMSAPTHHLAHLLRDNSGHGVDGLKNSAEALGEIRNRNPVSGAEQDHHRFADDPAESEEDGGNNPR